MDIEAIRQFTRTVLSSIAGIALACYAVMIVTDSNFRTGTIKFFGWLGLYLILFGVPVFIISLFALARWAFFS